LGGQNSIETPLCKRKIDGEPEKMLANLWSRRKITKKAHAGRGQEIEWEISKQYVGFTFIRIIFFARYDCDRESYKLVGSPAHKGVGGLRSTTSTFSCPSRWEGRSEDRMAEWGT
jgi:hypothetical protein